MNAKSLVVASILGIGFIACNASNALEVTPLPAREKLKTFTDPEGKSPGADINFKDLKGKERNLPVLEESEAGFYRVRVGDKSVWIIKAHVSPAAPEVAASCMTVDPRAGTTFAASRQANEKCTPK